MRLVSFLRDSGEDLAQCRGGGRGGGRVGGKTLLRIGESFLRGRGGGGGEGRREGDGDIVIINLAPVPWFGERREKGRSKALLVAGGGRKREPTFGLPFMQR